ncbi:MAG TPA: adenylate/guanylate cyclase domain-containing protein [Candidatus Limnocylindria bacterium]|nr:adenylate/guanylate cyclase domain-containing protein [Candidatus Limnocylindria bacterium]
MRKPAAERRLVSVLFADLVDFTSLAEPLDPEEVRAIQSRYFESARAVVARYGGTIEKFIGDAIMAVWGAPITHEDDAARAVLAALDFVAAVQTVGGPGGARMMARAAVMSGEAAVTIGAQGQGMVSGDLVNAAARLQAAAAANEVLASAATMHAASGAVAFESAGSYLLRGRSAEVSAYRAIGPAASAHEASPGRPVGRFVDREQELAELTGAAFSVFRDRTSRLISVIGAAGVGKSRLAGELGVLARGTTGSVAWLVGLAPAYGEGITFAPLADMVRVAAGVDRAADAEVARRQLVSGLAEIVRDDAEREWIEPRLTVLVNPDPAPGFERAELFAAWRRFFETVAERAPLVLVFEDLQWADASLLDFIEHLASWSRRHPLLILALARLELLQRRPAWAATVPESATIQLDHLPPAAMREMLQDLAAGLPAAAADLILERAGGIPLYAVEVIRMLVDRGELVPGDDGFELVEPLRQIELPDSLRGLVAARIDGLPPEDRTLLLSASVLGQRFRTDALAAISGLTPEELRSGLAGLARRELLTVSTEPTPLGDNVSFVEDLVREVAYRTVSRQERQSLHLAAADYLTSVNEEELVEAIGGHLLAAVRADADAPGADAVAGRARLVLRHAAHRALTLHASDRALEHLEDALSLAPEPPERADLLGDTAQAARMAAHFDRAERYLLEQIAYHTGEGHATDTARATAQLASLLLSETSHERAIGELESAIQAIGELDTEPASVELAGQLARARMLVGDEEAAVEWADRAISAAERLDLVAVGTDALITRGTARYRMGEMSGGLDDLERAVNAAAEGDLLSTELRARNNLAWLVVSDDPRATMRTAQRGLDLATAMGLGDMALQLADVVSLVAIDTGQWDWALAMLADLVPQPNLAPAHRLAFAANGAILRGLRGESHPEAALDALEPIDPETDLQLVAGLDYARAWLAFLDARYDDAREAADRAAAREVATGVERHYALALATRSSLWLGDLRAVEIGLTALSGLPVSGRFVQATQATLAAGLAALEGRARAGDSHYPDSAALWRALDLPFHLALCQLERHRLTDDQAALGEAVRILESLGGEGVLRAIGNPA